MTLHGLDPKALYEALRIRDRRFDGRVFVAVRSTGIYCRPVCTVRPPLFKNCTFHASAASAEGAGFRPCLRCRPELAPGSSAPVDAVLRLAALAVRRIEDGALAHNSLDVLAAEFGVTSRHLRRVVRAEVGLSPVELAQTQRLLMAKQLLTDTRMPITEVAFAAGFESLRRFHATFQKRYRLTPTALRRESATSLQEDAYTFELSARPPFDFTGLLSFWGARTTLGVECVSGGCYRRTVALAGHVGWVAIRPGQTEHTLRVSVSVELGPVLSTVLTRVKTMLDLRAEPGEIAARFSEDPLLAPLVARFPGTRVPGAFDGFEYGIRAILGQQISVKAATTVAGRLAAKFGTPISTTDPGLTTTFPTATTLASATVNDLCGIGMNARRAETIRALSRAVADGLVRLEAGADPDRTKAALVAIPGIGDWTAEYLLMRATAWPDAFPAGDLVLCKATGLTPNVLRDRAEAWRPWRSYAAILLWRSLS